MNADLKKLHDALARIDAWFAKHRPRFFAGLHPGADLTEIKSLPEELRVLLAWHNGQSGDFVGCFEEHWFLMSAADIREAHQGTTLIPFLDDDAGNYQCLDTKRSPCPVRLALLEETNAEIVADSLADWMGAFADNLEAGKYVEDPERGTFMFSPAHAP